MIKENYIEVIGHSRNKKNYTDLGYEIEIGKICLIKPEHLSKGCMSKVTSICLNCARETKNIFKDYWNYTKGFKEPYYCNKCKVIKSEKTSLKNWGVKNPMQNNEIKDRLKDSIYKKYGVSSYSQTVEWLNKFKNTSYLKWGHDNPSKNLNIISDIREKNTEMLRSFEFREKSKYKKQRNTWKKYASFLSDEYKVINYNTDLFTINHSICNKNFSITKGLLYNRLKTKSIICLNCNNISISSSSFEIEVGNFLKDLGISFEKRNRTILDGLELDYYLPDYNLAIECNGLYWHNELFKSKKYHINKTNMCKSKSINLVHIWEDDWNNKNLIVKSVLKNKLNFTNNIVYARECEIRTVDISYYKNFLDENHIQGYSSSSYNIGLFYKNELVSLMTFGWRRTNNKREYELIRFCNKLNFSVIGSASKLFNFFLRDKSEHYVVSYCDISMFTGNLYKKLGFKKVGLSDPNYYWIVDGIRRHRYNYSKRKLVKRGFDPNKTEVEIMNELGYWRIFSTGQEKWTFLK
jgi:G:T-mismatch repair DNA endonuclease (very short patch repair protein)